MHEPSHVEPTGPSSPQVHPRPQLTRERWENLSGVWQFAHDDDNRGLDARWYEHADAFDQHIVVPYPPESRASGVHATGYHPVVWYRRAISIAPQDRAGRALLHFGAVDYRAQVWVNGRLVAQHEGGHTPFTADITSVLTAQDTQDIVVRAEDDPKISRRHAGNRTGSSNPTASGTTAPPASGSPSGLNSYRAPSSQHSAGRRIPNADGSACTFA
ncbi:sugar-binding domain-containing protein [Deinococcus malanensis]